MPPPCICRPEQLKPCLLISHIHGHKTYEMENIKMVIPKGEKIESIKAKYKSTETNYAKYGNEVFKPV